MSAKKREPWKNRHEWLIPRWRAERLLKSLVYAMPTSGRKRLAKELEFGIVGHRVMQEAYYSVAMRVSPNDRGKFLKEWLK